jgi:hypothetical protein
MANGVMAVPETLVWSPGLVTVTELVTVQPNEMKDEKPALSLTVIVTVEDPAVVGVPEIVPLAGSMARPAGRVPPSA